MQSTKDIGVVKYSAYWCPNCLSRSELFGKQAYKELNVVECARDGKNSQTQYALIKKYKVSLMGNKWENILGVKTLRIIWVDWI